MTVQITIKDSHLLIILLFITAVSAIGLVVGFGGTSPGAMGHTWGEMECVGCIITSNLGDSQVTTAKIADSSVTSAKIADGTITNADIVSTGLNADTLDGVHSTALATWGSVCNPTWSSSCSCCDYFGTTVIYCSYYGRTLSIGGTSICLSSPTSQGSCGTQTCPLDSSCCY